MFTGRVVGHVVATRKDEKLQGRKLLVVQPVDATGRDTGAPLVAADVIGAGYDEVVILARAGEAAIATGLAPVDAAAIGIVDYMRRTPGHEVDAAELGFRPAGGEGP